MAKQNDKNAEKLLTEYFDRIGAHARPFDEVFAGIQAKKQAEEAAVREVFDKVGAQVRSFDEVFAEIQTKRQAEAAVREVFDKVGAHARPFDEVLTGIQAKRQAEAPSKNPKPINRRSDLSESASDVCGVCAGSRAAASGGVMTKRRLARKRVWVSALAAAMSAVLIFSLLGTFLYFHNRGNDVFLPPDDNLNMTVIDYDTLTGQGFFVPNLSGLSDVIIRRGDDKDTGVTKLFSIIGYFGGDRMAIRIVVHENFQPSDQFYFQGGSQVDIGQHTVWLNITQGDNFYVCRILFVQNTEFYYIELRTQNSGGYLPFLNAIFE